MVPGGGVLQNRQRLAAAIAHFFVRQPQLNMDWVYMTKALLPFVGTAGLAAFVAWVFWVCQRRAEALLREWAIRNGFQIIRQRQRYLFFTGPFRWRTNSRGQVIYFFTARDREGSERSGWARCGGYVDGLFVWNKIEVKWDES